MNLLFLFFPFCSCSLCVSLATCCQNWRGEGCCYWKKDNHSQTLLFGLYLLACVCHIYQISNQTVEYLAPKDGKPGVDNLSTTPKHTPPPPPHGLIYILLQIVITMFQPDVMQRTWLPRQGQESSTKYSRYLLLSMFFLLSLLHVCLVCFLLRAFQSPAVANVTPDFIPLTRYLLVFVSKRTWIET